MFGDYEELLHTISNSQSYEDNSRNQPYTARPFQLRHYKSLDSCGLCLACWDRVVSDRWKAFIKRLSVLPSLLHFIHSRFVRLSDDSSLVFWTCFIGWEKSGRRYNDFLKVRPCVCLVFGCRIASSLKPWAASEIESWELSDDNMF